MQANSPRLWIGSKPGVSAPSPSNGSHVIDYRGLNSTLVTAPNSLKTKSKQGLFVSWSWVSIQRCEHLSVCQRERTLRTLKRHLRASCSSSETLVLGIQKRCEKTWLGSANSCGEEKSSQSRASTDWKQTVWKYDVDTLMVVWASFLIEVLVTENSKESYILRSLLSSFFVNEMTCQRTVSTRKPSCSRKCWSCLKEYTWAYTNYQALMKGQYIFFVESTR